MFSLTMYVQHLCGQNIFPSNGSAGIGTNSPDASAILDIVSTSKGMLAPRMTKSQRNAILTPATGLLIYQTNSTPGFYYYSGSAWTPFSVKSANTSLSNLGTTSINTSLLPNTSGIYDLGSGVTRWSNAYFSGSVQVGATGVVPDAGMIQWNGSDFQGYNGANWVSLTGGGSSLWAASGTNIYNTNAGSVSIGNVALFSSIAGNNKMQIGSPDDPFNPAFSGNDLVIYTTDGINGMSFSNTGTSSIWYTTQNFALMPNGGNGFTGIGTTTPSTKLEVLTPDSKWGIIHSNGSVRMGTYVGSSGGWLATQTNSPLYFATGLLSANSSAQMTLLLNGNLGIGTIHPTTKIQVQTGDASYGITQTNGVVTIGTYVGSGGGWLGTQTNHPLYFFANNSNALATILPNGNMGIGTIVPAYKLSVNGTIQAKEVRVETGWSDFVFNKDYQLKPLNEVEKYINANKHLQDIPSAKEIQENGLAIAETQTKMMQKIEELTLYIIQLQKEIDKLKADKK